MVKRIVNPVLKNADYKSALALCGLLLHILRSMGKGREFDLPAGQHRLKAKTRWFGSKETNFTLFNKEKKSYVISTNKFLIRFLAILASFDVFLLIAGRNYHSEHKFILILKTFAGMMFLIIAVYFFTIGRSNYLIIKEEGAD